MAKRKKRYKGKKLSSGALKSSILRLFIRMPKKRFNAKQISAKLKTGNNVDAIKHALTLLEEEGKILHVKDGKFRLDKTGIKDYIEKLPSYNYKGKVDMARNGSAFLVVDELEEDLFIPNKHLKGAMNGDIVEVSAVFPKNKRKGEAKVKSILKRAISSVVGKIYFQKRYCLVDVLHTKSPLGIMVKPSDAGKAKDGDIVVVDIVNWGNAQNKTIWGRVKEVIPADHSHEVTMQSILSLNGFDSFYPDDVLQELKFIPDELQISDYDGRKDFREKITFTIDPDTAKDFDDAISYAELENGNIEVGVHIADVTHYVTENSAIDKEAYRRSTSVYLVDRCVAMLPEKLSNNLCSLNPNVDRLSFSAVFEFDNQCKIKNRWFGRTVIHSDRRFTYEEAQEVLETGEGDYAKELKKLNEIALKLRKQKFKDGAVNFDSEEVKFKLDERGKPLGLYVKERKAAHMLIEDLMLLANREVARFIGDRETKTIPFVYRVHDTPDLERLAEVSLFAKELGFDFSFQSPMAVKESINALSKASKENEALKLIEPLAIRCMAKAIYTTNNIGHYGLAFPFYAHFTSPIRRYADVLVHRILYANLKNETRVNQETLEAKCKHISSQEKMAAEAERESIKYKQVEFMASRLNESFEGVISGIIDRGIFVEIKETKAEGFVPMISLYDDFQYAGSRFKLQGKATGDIIKFGDTVKVKLIDVNLEDKQLEFRIIE